ncbi:MAG: M48 family metalloprotease [Planctomycetes bacterium]|nr:M48 family metalloprotease [Planctomycetota bacterium]
MHLQIIAAFAMLLWWPDQSPPDVWVSSPVWCTLLAWLNPAICILLARIFTRKVVSRLRTDQAAATRTLNSFHRKSGILRLILLAGVGADLFLTGHPGQLMASSYLSVLPGLPQMFLLLPYLMGMVGLWWVTFPVERASRDAGFLGSTSTRFEYVVFNVRHQLLIVAIPLSLIVIAYAATHENRAWFVQHTGSPWAPEAVLGFVATVLFIVSPVLLRYIWSTSPLPPGPLRDRLEALCARIGLRVSDILIWNSGGQLVNAAVMGIFPRVRYIMLSDALIDSMTEEETESVFGHEAGHVHHHHIPFFLLFALASMLVVSGIMELLTRMSQGVDAIWELDRQMIQTIGMAALLPLWGICFGWISRRFERQADVYGAWCASPHDDNAACKLPCCVHNDIDGQPGEGVCATGAQTFVGALRKVAFLNGIPPTEPSWRHSSIASRMAFLTAQSGDSMMALRFARKIRNIKRCLLACCLVGLIITGAYVGWHPGYRRDIVRSVVEPMRRLFN